MEPDYQSVEKLHRDVFDGLIARVGQGFAVLCAAYVAAHFALFPVLWNRFFVAQIPFVALLFLTTVRLDAGEEAG